MSESEEMDRKAREMVEDPEGYFARARAEYAKIKMPTTKRGVLDLLAKVKGRRA